MKKKQKEDILYNLLENRRKYKHYFIKKSIKYKFALYFLIIFLLFIIAYFILRKLEKKKTVKKKKNNYFLFFEDNSTDEIDITNENILNEKNNKTKVCLCAIGKNENLYIKEFVTYYKNLGYDHIFLYDNNDENGQRFEDVIQEEINENFVSIINYRGYRGDNNNPQFKAYYDCYQKNNKAFNWLSFFDIDEYLYINYTNITIQDFFDNNRYNKCQQIKINWLTYSDNDFIHYENRPLKERFTKKSKDRSSNRHIKSTVRGNLSINYWGKAYTPHSTSYPFFNACSSSGRKTSNIDFQINPDYKFAHLKHYSTKTIEEFCNKLKRGRATCEFIINEKNLKKRFDRFFT